MLRLVVAPHMDDESMGCGGLLAKFPDECHVLTIADSGPIRASEHANAMAALGVRNFRNLGFTDGQLDVDMPRLVAALDAAVAVLRPDELYLPFPSLHQDHIAVYEAGMRTARVSMSVNHWFPPAVLIYDIAAYDVALYPTDLRFNVFEPLSAEHVGLKAAACLAYESEIPGAIHPINSVREIAAAIGRLRLVAFAEQYALVRQVRP